MQDNTQAQMTPEEQQVFNQQVKWYKQARNGASWFFWIAGLSLINTLATIFDLGYVFFAGLGITQIIDIFASLIIEENLLGNTNPALVWGIALVINIVIAGIFVALGLFARNRKPWAFITGIVLFSLDALLFLVVAGDLLGFGFHIFVVVMLVVGLIGLNKLRQSLPQQPGEDDMVVEQL